MCADVCIYDTYSGTPHAHIMLTTHLFTEEKTWGDKQKKEYILDPQGEKIYDKKKRSYKCKSVPTTDWNEQAKAEKWRNGWADKRKLIFGKAKLFGADRPPLIRATRRPANPHRPFRRCGFSDGEARNAHRARHLGCANVDNALLIIAPSYLWNTAHFPENYVYMLDSFDSLSF